MIITYQTLRSTTSADLDAQVVTAIAVGKQPFGTRSYANGQYEQTVTTEAGVSGAGTVPAAVAATVVATEGGNPVQHETLITLTDLPQAVVNGVEYQSTKIYTFPEGRIVVLGVTASIAQKTTSVIADTLNSGVTGALAIGTVAASNVSLTSTMVNLLPSTAFVTSTVINTAAAPSKGALAVSAQFDGTTTAVPVYLNTAYATTGDVDADATQTLSGTVRITWANLGDY